MMRNLPRFALLGISFLSACSSETDSQKDRQSEGLAGVSFAQPAEGGTNPPGDGGQILVPPSNDRYVVRVSGSFSATQLAALAALGLSQESSFSDSGNQVGLFSGPPGVSPSAISGAVGSPTGWATVNIPTPLGDGTSLTGVFVVSQFDVEAFHHGPNGLESLNLEQAASDAPAGGSGIKIAILDTGADTSHPALLGHFFFPQNCPFSFTESPADGVDEDASGEADEAFGHGTHLAGIVCRIAPQAQILPLRVMNEEGVASLWDILRAINYARSKGAKVINLSFAMASPEGTFEALLQSVSNSGIVVVAAGGNLGATTPTYPGTSAYATGVAAVDETDVMPSFSGSGLALSFAAPGVDILSTYPNNLSALTSGTSMSSAVVAGCVALVASDQVLGAPSSLARLATAPNFVPIFGGEVRYGRPNVCEAVD